MGARVAVLLGELDMNKEAQGTALREVPLEHIMAQKAAQKQEKVSVIFFILTQLTYLNLFCDFNLYRNSNDSVRFVVFNWCVV